MKHMEMRVCDWPVNRLGPSGIFEHIGQNTMEMLSMLDDKMRQLAPLAGYSKRMFTRWLNALHQMASAVIFHGGEVVSDGMAPLTVIVVPNGTEKKALLADAHRQACSGVMDIGVVSETDFMPLFMERGVAPR